MGVTMVSRIAPSVGFLAAATLFAQGVVHTGPVTLPPPNGARYGNILFPGGTPSSNLPPAPRLGSLVPTRGLYSNGNYSGGYVSPPSRGGNHGGRDRTIVVPYAYPVYFGDYGYNGYGGNPAPQPITVVVPPQQQTVPTVIINQTFAADVSEVEPNPNEEAANPSGVRVYKTPVHRQPAPEPAAPAVRDNSGDDRATIYLIALKDNSIHSAIGYWVEDGTLHYVTQQGSVNRVTLDQVDRQLSDQLNRERKVDFQIRTK
jgi:hypothetical protein